jgi:hypothetical protein
MKYGVRFQVTMFPGHREGFDDQAGAHMIGHLPAHDHASAQVDHGC